MKGSIMKGIGFVSNIAPIRRLNTVRAFLNQRHNITKAFVGSLSVSAPWWVVFNEIIAVTDPGGGSIPEVLIISAPLTLATTIGGTIGIPLASPLIGAGRRAVDVVFEQGREAASAISKSLSPYLKRLREFELSPHVPRREQTRSQPQPQVVISTPAIGEIAVRDGVYIRHLMVHPPTGGEAQEQQYLVVKQLSQPSGQADVYEVLNMNEGGRKEILKVLRASAVRGDAQFERFEEEIRALAGLADNPRIVNVYGFGIDNERPFYTMENIEGSDLSYFLSLFDTIPIRTAIHVIKEVALALAAAHERQIIHRDLKPGNVMIQKGPRVRLIDFGIAKNRAREEQITETEVTVGTPGFMAPEQYTTSDVDAKADLFSLGVLFYLLLSGHSPYPRIGNETERAYSVRVFEIFAKQKRGEASLPDIRKSAMPTPFVEAIIPGRPSSGFLDKTYTKLNEILHSLLAPDKDKRCPDAGSLVAQLTVLEQLLGAGLAAQDKLLRGDK